MDEDRFRESRALLERSRRVIPCGVWGHSRFPAFIDHGSYPYFLERAEGAYVFDVDGRRYVDYLCGYGAMVSGYANPVVEDAVRRQSSLGDALAQPMRVSVDLAELLSERVKGAAWSAFGKNGSDATAIAFLVARAHTGRPDIVCVEGSFHSSHLWAKFCNPGAGRIEDDSRHVRRIAWNDAAALDELLEQAGDRIGAVMMTPFHLPFGGRAALASPEFLQAIARARTKHGCLVVSDDVRAGFRTSMAGSHAFFGYDADIVCFSKALGNTHAISAVVGSERVRAAAEGIFMSGTFWNSAPAMAAALANLRSLEESNGIGRMHALGARLCAGLTSRGRAHGLSVELTGISAIPNMTIAEDDLEMSLMREFSRHMVAEGFLVHPTHNWFVSSAHTEADIDETLEAADRSLARTAEALARRSQPSVHVTVPAVVTVLPTDALEVERAASEAARARRRVADWTSCRSPGLSRVLEGIYGNRAPAPAFETDEGVMLIKPSMRVNEATLEELSLRLAECGYLVRSARRWSGADVKSKGLARRHYLAHFDVAARGTLDARERACLLRIYDHDAFVRAFGARASEVPVMPVDALVAAGVPQDVVQRWSERAAEARGLNSGEIDGANEIGDYTFVNVFRDEAYLDGRAVFVLNPHMLTVGAALESTDGTIYAFHVERASSTGLSWARLRRELCGATDPEKAMPGSLRGDALRGIFPLERLDGGRVSRTNNGIHLSNGPVEAAREISIWFERPIDEVATARRLAGRSGIALESLLDRPHVRVGSHKRVLADVTNGMSTPMVLSILRVARTAREGTEQVVERVDEAHAIARRLGSHVMGVLADGRSFRAKRPRLRLLAVVEGAVTEPTSNLGPWEIETIDVTTLASVTSARSLAARRWRARFGDGVVLADRAGFLRSLSAHPMDRPDPSLLDAAWEHLGRMEEKRRVTLRALAAAVETAVFLRLACSPYGYQGAREALEDLEHLGESALRDLLLDVDADIEGRALDERETAYVEAFARRLDRGRCSPWIMDTLGRREQPQPETLASRVAPHSVLSRALEACQRVLWMRGAA